MNWPWTGSRIEALKGCAAGCSLSFLFVGSGISKYLHQASHLTLGNRVVSLLPMEIYHSIGEMKLRAWCAFSGSVPILVINGISAAAGALLVERHLLAGSALLSFALCHQLFLLKGPLACLSIPADRLAQKALSGHHFAFLATHLGDILSIYSENLALGACAAWVLFVPAVAMGVWLVKFTHLKKQKILPEPVSTTLTYISSANMTALLGIRIIQFLRWTYYPSLSAFAEVLRKTVPIFAAISVLPAACQTWQQLRSDAPTGEKMLSIAFLVTSVAAGLGIALGQLSPPYIAASFVLMGFGMGAELILNAVKADMLAKRALP